MERKELPEGWDIITLSDERYFQRFGGSTPSKSRKEYWDNGTIPWLSNTELNENEINYVCNTREKITPIGLDNSSTSLLPKHCVLLTCTASIGKVGINEIELSTNQQFNSFKCSGEIEPKFLAFFLLTQKNNLIKLGGSTSFCHINTVNLGKLKIPLPPHPIQRQIVAVLEQAEALKRQRQEADTLMGALLQSVFYEMFGDPVRNEKGWDVVQIRDITRESQYGCSVLGTSNGQYPIMGMNNITYEGQMELTNLKFVDLSEKEFEKFRLEKGDILFNRSNAPNLVGKTGLFRTDENFVFASYLIRLKLKFDLINPEYFWKFLNTPYMKSKFSGMCKKAVNQANINAQELQNVAIPLPPLALQQQFARVVEEVERIRERQVESGMEIEALSGGLVQRAFRGELIA